PLVRRQRRVQQREQQRPAQTARALIHARFIPLQEQVRRPDLAGTRRHQRGAEREVPAPLSVRARIRDQERSPALSRTLEKTERPATQAVGVAHWLRLSALPTPYPVIVYPGGHASLRAPCATSRSDHRHGGCSTLIARHPAVKQPRPRHHWRGPPIFSNSRTFAALHFSESERVNFASRKLFRARKRSIPKIRMCPFPGVIAARHVSAKCVFATTCRIAPAQSTIRVMLDARTLRSYLARHSRQQPRGAGPRTAESAVILENSEKSMVDEATRMWETCAVDLRVSLPKSVAAEVEKVQQTDPEML